MRVTNLLPEGPGSLRAALAQKSARLVVFEVGGVIDLKGVPLRIEAPQAFVAGETAPAPGITLIRGSLIIEADHVIVRHLAVRPGDGRPRADAPWEPDGITIVRGSVPVHDVLIQNCSATWAVDENMSASGPRDVRRAAGVDATSHDIAFRNNLIGEALLNSTHAKGAHSMGLLIHDGIRNVTIDGNLFAHNRERNPRLKGGVSGAVINNVIYDWGSAAIGVGSKGNLEMLDGVRAVVRGNIAIGGVDTKGKVLVRAVDPGASVLANFNLARDATGRELKELDEGITRLREGESSGGGPRPDLRQNLIAVLSGAGFRPAERDEIDRRIVESVINGTGRIIDSQEEVGGYPKRAETKRALTVPDGKAKRLEWLEQMMKALEFDPQVNASALLKRLNLPR
ncbi:MAG: hypothetical protein ABIP62_09855 [Vicinamibacteria bacterium]